MKLPLPANPPAPGVTTSPAPMIPSLPNEHQPAPTPGKTGGQASPPGGKTV